MRMLCSINIKFIAEVYSNQTLRGPTKLFMRSLFVEDIPGATPTHRYFDKALFRERHQVQIDRFGPKQRDHKRNFEWYKPIERHVEPIDKNEFPLKVTRHLHHIQRISNPETMTQSLVDMKRSREKVAGKVNELSPRLSKSTVLSGSGKHSLENSLPSSPSVAAKNQLPSALDNPYFPHMYVDQGTKSKWTGARFWDQRERNEIIIPKESQTSAKNFMK